MLISDIPSMVEMRVSNTGRPSSTKNDKVQIPSPAKQGQHKDMENSSYNGSMFEDEEDGSDSDNKSDAPLESPLRSVGQN